MSHHITSSHVTSHSIPYHTIPCRTAPCCTLPYRTAPYRSVPYRTTYAIDRQLANRSPFVLTQLYKRWSITESPGCVCVRIVQTKVRTARTESEVRRVHTSPEIRVQTHPVAYLRVCTGTLATRFRFAELLVSRS